MMVPVKSYPPAIEEQRHKLLELIEGERREFYMRCQPYLIALARLENCASISFIVSPSELV